MKIHTASALVLGAAALATGLGLAPTKPGTETASITSLTATSHEAATFQIDPVHSTSIFRVHHQKAGMFYGMFDKITGTIEFDPENPNEMKFDVTIDVNSIHTGSEGRNEQLNQHLMSEDFFNAKEHGAMTFKSTSATKVDDGAFEVAGDLTIRGTSKPVTVLMDLVGMNEGRRGKKIGFETKFEINRTDYGVSYMADSGMLGTDVRILVSMEAGTN